MRILVVSNFYPPAHFGGYELDCEQVVNGLRERHDILVLTSRYQRDHVPRQHHVMRELRFTRPGHRLDVARAPAWAIAAARLSDALLKEFNPDIIFIWNSSQIPQAAIWSLAHRGVPVAYRACDHGLEQLYSSDSFMRFLTEEWSGAKRLWSAYAKLANRHPSLQIDPGAKSAAAIAWVSDFLRHATPVSPALQPTVERTIYIGVPQQDPVPVETALGQVSFGFVGRLAREKAPDIAINALHRLRTQHGVAASLVLAGTGDAAYLAELHDLVSRLSLHRHVRFLGVLQRSQVLAVMAELSALVVPSRWQEPSGTVASEAAAVGIPVVAARSGGMPEYLPEKTAALFFDIDDVDGCARALATTVTDTDDTRARVARAHRRAQILLTVEAEIMAMERFLADAAHMHQRDR